MTKLQFLAALERALTKLPASERADIIEDYEEYFMIGKENGETEEEISASLGNPSKLGRELSAVYHVEHVRESSSAGGFFRALWAVIGLGFFNLVIVLGPFIALAAIVFSGWMVALSFILSPLGVLINTLIYPEYFRLYDLFFSFGLAGAGIIIGVAMFVITGWLKDLFIRYFNFNLRMVKGGVQHA